MPLLRSICLLLRTGLLVEATLLAIALPAFAASPDGSASLDAGPPATDAAPSPPSPAAPAVASPAAAAVAATAAAAAAADAPRVGRLAIIGSVDPPGRLEGMVARLVPPGTIYVERGAADAEGAPISTPGKLQRLLERLGYHATFITARVGDRVDLDIRVRAADRIRHIFILGNWPLRHEDILRSFGLRPGQALPDPGPEREARLERERQSVINYLRGRGYMEAQVTFELRVKRSRRKSIEMVVSIALGPGYPLGPIVVEGAHAISPEDVADNFRHLDWRFLWRRPTPFDRGQLRRDVREQVADYRKIGYVMARVTDDYNPSTSIDPVKRDVRLKLSVLERKRVEVIFEGHKKISTSDLREALTIDSSGSYNSFETQVSAEAIEQLYRSQGHLFVKVTWRADSGQPDLHRIVFSIHEGPSLKVKDVAFLGNQAFTASQLEDVVTVRAFPFLGFLGIGEGGYASIKQLELDLERLAGHYAASGYPGTRVRCEIAVEPGAYRPLGPIRPDDPAVARARGLWVRFVVEEAPRIDVTAVDFDVLTSGTLPLGENFLRESLDGKVGRPFRPEVLRSDADRLRRLLGDQGHPRARVEAVPLDDGRGGKRLVYRIELGPPLRVGPMFVRGNFFTTERTIRRWTLLPEGAPLTVSALERSRRQLALIQILNNPTITLLEEAEQDGLTPVLVEMEERHDHLGVARIGGGASTEQAEPGGFPLGAYWALGYEHRNLFGQSWILLSRAELGRALTRFNSEFTDPRFLGSLFRLNLAGTYLRQTTVRLGDLRSGGGILGFSRELGPGVDLSLHYALRSTVSTEFLLRGAGPDLEQETVAITTIVGAFGLGLEWQRLDSPLVPTRGFKLEANIEWARPEFSLSRGADTFIKAGARMLNVMPLSRRMSLRHSLRYDQGFPLGGASLLPKVERFFAGGDTTVRGFELDRARTDDINAESFPGLPFTQRRPLGGALRVLQNLDLQFQILGPWFGAVFVDSGVVADGFDGLEARTFRHGAGVAPVVVKLPIGDLSIAWAWPLDPRPGDPTSGRLHFNVGLMF